MDTRTALRTMLTNLLASRKWTFALVVVGACAILFAMGRLTKDDFLGVVKWIGAPLLVATGVEKIGSSSDGTVAPAAPAAKDGGAS